MRCTNLCKAYDGQVVLQAVSHTFPVGITCVMGPSGVGKTTLLRLLAGLEQPDSGTVEMTGVSVAFQEPRLLSHLTALGNLRFALGGHYQEKTALELLERLGLGQDLDKPVSAYSGGMARRLSLARALLYPHQCLLLDEPFAGLDSAMAAVVRDCIAQAGKTAAVVLVTHDPEDGVRLGANVLEI